MRVTPFAGLTVLEPGEPFSTDGYSFQERNPELIDRFLRVGAVTHRHDEHPALGDPDVAASAVAVASAGSFPAEVDATFGYTLVDAWGGETLISPLSEVTTPAKIAAPDPPTGSADYAAGGLLAGTYTYVKTWTDGAGGETTASVPRSVTLDPGHASGRVRFTDLNDDMVTVGAAGWRIYKSGNGSSYHFLASGAGATLDDDGSLCADCVSRPPSRNTSNDKNTIELTMVGAGEMADAVSFRLYGSIGAGFTSPSFFGEYPVASAGLVYTFTAWNPGPGTPPPVSTAIPGASKIDPDIELVDWYWKRPVAASGNLPAGVAGDVRLVMDTKTLWTPSGASAAGPAGWQQFFPPGRATAVASAAAVASGATVQMSIELVPAYTLYRLVTNRATRIRLYAASAYQAPDAARAVSVDPAGDHGVIVDYSTASGDLDWAITPPIDGMNLDAIDNTIPLTITNLGATGDVIVTLTYLRRE